VPFLLGGGAVLISVGIKAETAAPSNANFCIIKGVGIFFEEEHINTLSSDGELMLSVIASFAEEELRSMSNNQKWSIQKRYREGKMNAQGMMGYKKDNYGGLEINKKQAKIIKRIFDMYINGESTEKIANQLNTEQVPTYRNKKWTSGVINGILKNEKYKGDCRLNKFYCPSPNKKVRNNGEVDSYYIEDNHPAIVTRETWDKANKIIAERSASRKTADYTKRYLLSGLLICPHCGSTLRRKKVHNDRIEWWCSKSIREGVKACKGIHIKDEDAMAQNITEPTVVKEIEINGKKCYSYTSKSEYTVKDNTKPQSKPQAANGGILQSQHRQRRTIIKL
jgi:hypothetical protein